MASNSKEKRKKRLEKIAFISFFLSLGGAVWSLVALLGDVMNSRLLFIPFVSFVPPLGFSLLMYLFCKYVQKKADKIVTEREEEEELRRQDLVAKAKCAAGTNRTDGASDT